MKTQIRNQEIDLYNPSDIIDKIRQERLGLNEVLVEYSTHIVLVEGNEIIKKLIESQKEFLRMCDKWGLE